MEPVQAQQEEQAPLQFKFTGNGREYFNIWIVNLFLTIVTLGIYSAWAKVRRNRYFYGNTRLGDAAFDYVADPKVILRGRLIATACFVFYSLVIKVWPFSVFFFWAIFIVILPWVVVKSLTFRARNTVFRNIRFNFKGNYRGALKAFVFKPMLIFISLGFALPYVVRIRRKFIVENSGYGTTAFAFTAKNADFYRLYGILLLIMIGCGIAVALLIPLAAIGGRHSTFLGVAATSIMFILASLFYLFVFSYLNSHTANLVFNHTALGGHRFSSSLRVRDVFFLYLTNILGIALTLGLFIPWAKVRMMRYHTQQLQFLPQGSMEQFVAQELHKISSVGEEMGEMFDLDLAL